MEARIYNRVSTGKQAKTGLSDEAAEMMCRHECDRLGWDVESAVFEVKSSRRTRPVLDEALSWASTGPDRAVMVAVMDRICRDLLEFLEILRDARKGGYLVHCVDLPFDITTPEGMYSAQMRGANAEFERALISKRTRAAMAVLARRGVKLGRASHKAPRIVPEHCRDYIRWLRTHEYGLKGQPLSYRAIARRLNEERVPSADGRTWGASSVALVCSRPVIGEHTGRTTTTGG